MGRSGWRRSRQSAGARLHRAEPAVSRLLFQSFERARSRCAFGPKGHGREGLAAPLGEMDFVVKGAMIGGFALAAAPTQYRVTGVQTFIVGPNGLVYQKDLGADTLKTFQSMDKYNPDKTWTVTEDDVQQDQDSESQAQ